MDINPEESERLTQLRRALEEEFATKDDASRKSALQDLEDLKGDMLEALQHVLKHGTTDALRSKVAMWGYDKLLEQGKASKDTLAELLDGIPTSNSPE